LVKNNKIKKDKYFVFVTMHKWSFIVKLGKIPNLHQIDNITNPDKSKYLFLFFIRLLTTFVHNEKSAANRYFKIDKLLLQKTLSNLLIFGRH
jgi:hypothetical protein